MATVSPHFVLSTKDAVSLRPHFISFPISTLHITIDVVIKYCDETPTEIFVSEISGDF